MFAGDETRELGRTGERVTILGLGTAPVGEGPPDVQEAVKVFGAALDAGVTYVDTARIYGNAEEALGHLLPKRRDNLFVVTKCWTDSAEGAESLGGTHVVTAHRAFRRSILVLFPQC